MINAIFEQFVAASPVSVMVRATMERIFSNENLDELFEETSEKQYTRELLFSSVVGLMSLVVSGIHPSVNAAYKALEKQIGVSKPALYGKLNGLEPQISQALVRSVTENLRLSSRRWACAAGSNCRAIKFASQTAIIWARASIDSPRYRPLAPGHYRASQLLCLTPSRCW